ncbi:MAG: hypothetical protein LRY76_06565 [Alphaproteobacteria bacterium]|nr:hypothetical protein [Alphaproteobacteria bacterium]MCD8571169.1 hypothetical protein [Alphaproteobacteria bacterium]
MKTDKNIFGRKYTNLALLWADYNKDPARAIDVMADYLEIPYSKLEKAYPAGSAEEFNTARKGLVGTHLAVVGGSLIMFPSVAGVMLSSVKVCEGTEQAQLAVPECKSIVPAEGALAGVALGTAIMVGALFRHTKHRLSVYNTVKDVNTVEPSQG